MATLFVVIYSDAAIIKHFDRTNGLGSDLIKGIAFDRFGYLWIGTENGLDRYDGAGFNHYELYNISENFSKENRVVSLNTLEDGSILGIAINGLTFRAVGDTIQPFPLPVNIFKNFSKLNISKDAETLQQMNYVCRFYRNKIIIRDNYGQYKIKNQYGNVIGSFTFPDSYDPDALSRLFNLGSELHYLDKKMNLWKYENDHWIKTQTLFGILKQKKSNTSNAIVTTNRLDPNAYISIGSTVYVLTHINPQDTFDYFHVDIKDLNGPIYYIQYSSIYKTLCVGTTYDGLYLFQEQTYTNDILYSTGSERGLIFIDSVRLFSSLYKIIHDNNISNFRNYDPKNKTNAFVKDQYGRILFYFNKEKPEIQRVTFGKSMTMDKTNVPFNEYPTYLFEDPMKRIWVFFPLKGAIIYKNPKVGPLNEISRLDPLHHVTKVVLQDQHLLAFNNSKTVYRININDLSYTSETLEKDPYLIRDVYPLGKDSFILATYGYGIFVYLKGNVLQIPNDHNLSLKYAHCINLIDNHFVISTNSGIITFKKKHLYAYIQNKQPIKYKLISQFSDFKNEFNGACVPCSQVKDGHIFYPHIQGIADIDIRSHLNEHIQTNGFKLDSFAINLEPFNSMDQRNLHINLDENDDAIRLMTKTIYYGDRSNLRIKVEVKNENYQFDSIFYQSEIVLSHLPSGFNSIQLTLYNSEKAERTIHLTVWVPEKFYESWIFWLLLIVSIISIIYLTMYIFGYYLKLRNRILRRRVKEATKELHNLVDQISKDKENLEKAAQFKNKIISVITHDVLGPIGSTNLLLEHMCQNSSNEQEKHHLNEIKKSNENILHQSFEILTWSKARNNSFKPVIKPFDLCKMIQGALQKFNFQMTKKHISLLNETPIACEIKSDPSILGIILTNTIENAIKYGNDFIRIQYQKNSTQHTILISNAGPTFNPRYVLNFNNNDLNKASEHVSNAGNGGYGLRICKELIQIIDGDISIETKENLNTVKIIVPYHN